MSENQASEEDEGIKACYCRGERFGFRATQDVEGVISWRRSGVVGLICIDLFDCRQVWYETICPHNARLFKLLPSAVFVESVCEIPKLCPSEGV